MFCDSWSDGMKTHVWKSGKDKIKTSLKDNVNGWVGIERDKSCTVTVI